MIPDERVFGKVKWYNAARSFGVITGEDNKDYFIYHTNLPEGPNFLKADMIVSFRYRPRQRAKRGMEAYEIAISEVKEGEQSKVKHQAPRLINQHHLFTSAEQKGHLQAETNRSPTEKSPISHSKKNLPINQQQSIQQPRYSDLCGREIVGRVKGVRYENRQSIVAQIPVGEKLMLIRDLVNKYDKNAIQVERTNGQVVGYIDRNLAQDLARIMDEFQKRITAIVVEKTGGVEVGTCLGLRIKFTAPGSTRLLKTFNPSPEQHDPILIRVANSNQSKDMLTLPSGDYKLMDSNGQITVRTWGPGSIGHRVIWRSLINCGCRIILPHSRIVKQ